ncbi:helix-turn-helix domain-containing protein [Nocardia sp. NPDC049707]|uniref:MarR family transcriptional regulator n=1 Tax=Nocardia sp. NPDC049707 TaxID=3154735 RepID=UPI0034164E0A
MPNNVEMTEPQAAVLAVLAPGGLLTVEQIARGGRLTPHQTRWAISVLRSRGLVAPGGSRSSRYQISGLGLRAFATCGRVAR